MANLQTARDEAVALGGDLPLEARAHFRELDRIGAQVFRESFRMRDEVERFARLVLHAMDPRAQIVRGDGFRLEGRIVRGRCQRYVQLRCALGEHLHERNVGPVHILGRHGAGAPILEEADEIVGGVFPPVALVRHECLQQRERVYRAVVVSILDRASNGNDVRELRNVREIAADLELRARAGIQPPIKLEEHLLAETQRRVRALRSLGSERKIARSFCHERRVRRGHRELDHTVLCGHVTPGADRFDE